MSSKSNLALNNAAVVMKDRLIERGTVMIDSGLIVSVTESLAAPQVPALDLSGLVLLPGFIDVHIHGAAGIDTMDASAQQLHEMAEFLATQGVTGWLATLVPGSDEKYANVAAAVSEVMKDSATSILGVHYEGPFVNSAQCGALHVEHFKTYTSPEDLDCLPAPENAVRMITMAPEVDGGVELVRDLKDRGWVISIGHTRASLELLDDAFESGARHMTHFMNAMLPLHHRNPGPIGWGLSREDVTCDIIADGIHLDPSIVRLLLKIKGSGRLSLISDAIAATGKGDGSYRIWGETITVSNGRTSNASGNIAGSVITMLDAVRMMRSLGVPDVEIAWMASSNPARLLRIDHECGSIEEGKRADLVAIDGEGRVRLTLEGGNIVFRE